LPLIFIKPAQIELHLPFICRLEVAKLQIDGDQPPQITIIK
jgi:hypothetical protein